MTDGLWKARSFLGDMEETKCYFLLGTIGNSKREASGLDHISPAQLLLGRNHCYNHIKNSALKLKGLSKGCT